MSINDALLPEFDQEMARTRRLLERVPDEKAAWTPHEKSRSLGALASHLADIPGRIGGSLNQESLDMAPAEGREPPRPWTTREEALSRFDKGVAAARANMTSNDDESYRRPWSLKRTGKALFTVPRAAMVRTFVLSHIIHHRGQLSVYLRLVGVPLPSIYGPTADEGI